MAEEIPVKRAYNSTRRQEQARELRRSILEAARSLFEERGYGGTTLEAIAVKARVAVETVYSAYGSKRNLLAQLVSVAIRGDDAPPGILDREGPRAMQQEMDQEQQLRMFAHGMREVLPRVGPLFHIMRSAADTEPEIASLLKGLLAERLENMKRIAGWVKNKGPLNKSADETGTTLWALSSPDLHRLLTVDLGWEGEQYERWLGDTLVATLLPKPDDTE